MEAMVWCDGGGGGAVEEPPAAMIRGGRGRVVMVVNSKNYGRMMTSKGDGDVFSFFYF